MRIGVAIDDLASAEGRLAEALLELGERHKADHDVFHLSRTLARWAHAHIAALEPFAARYATDVEAGDLGREHGGPLHMLREKGAELLGRRPEAGLLLLRDMRALHLLAAEASANWTILGQAAQAANETELLECVSRCHPETLRTMRWALNKLKESAPQILTT
ncbi:MAG: hypothetical protein ICV69_03510 [Thermoleophilaceae bacterium]|nr:hypothetical protein [Thermoleophilaceae bacterium]